MPTSVFILVQQYVEEQYPQSSMLEAKVMFLEDIALSWFPARRMKVVLMWNA